MRVSSVIRIDQSKIKALTEAQMTALEMTAEALHTEVIQAQVMPFDTGNLQNESTFVDTSELKNGKVSLVSTTPYARRLYYHPEYTFSTEENLKAGGEWYKDWLSDGKKSKFCQNAYKNFYKRITGV